MQDLIACHDCDLLHRRVQLPHGTTARCSRCNSLLQRQPGDMLDRCLALSLASGCLLLVANLLPFITFEIGSREQGSLMTTGVDVLHQEGYTSLSVAVAFTGVVAPMLVVLGLIYLTLPLKLGRRVPGMVTVTRLIAHLKPWSMMEVYLLGVIVTFAKLSAMAELVLGPGCYAFVILIITMTAAMSAFDAQLVWSLLEQPQPAERPAGART